MIDSCTLEESFNHVRKNGIFCIYIVVYLVICKEIVIIHLMEVIVISAIDWVIIGVILIGLIVWLTSGRVFYMLVYFALFSLGSLIYRLSNNHSLADAFFSSLGLVDILVIVITSALLIEKLKDNKS
ncbi:hypothetical protein CHH48_08990 [Terribacillus saccharophilus]|uniref:DUF2127 domain-containing protein n=1 Tax=Terribacillus saccharophilus TaxID=361277 RepID=A0ABX4GZ27_9BACI|nr:hypothetical protein CHH56_08475 [Terribacillus saccharophilus]PAD96551.1 hypothetical protein CHH50_08085 [Terribacillus saccharophilus]PAE00127.1 hypothetical protein CHH48_08990 [Terribacillus saccharophilus]